MKNYSIQVTGTVQGVWFRKFTKDRALELGINGFVKNLTDGSVYIEAEGGKRNLGKFLVVCSKGPDRAYVKKVVITEHRLKDYKHFTIET